MRTFLRWGRVTIVVALSSLFVFQQFGAMGSSNTCVEKFPSFQRATFLWREGMSEDAIKLLAKDPKVDEFPGLLENCANELRDQFEWSNLEILSIALMVFSWMLVVREYRRRSSNWHFRYGSKDFPLDLGLELNQQFRIVSSAFKATASAGLLNINKLDFSSVAIVENNDNPIIAKTSNLDQTVFGIPLSTLFTFYSMLLMWIDGSGRMLTATSTRLENHLVVQFVARFSNGKKYSFLVSAELINHEQITQLARRAAFKMTYILSTSGSELDVSHKARLADGIISLDRFLKFGDQQELQESYRFFRTASAENPSDFEPTLYEAVALELLERHGEAEDRFKRVIDSSTDEHVVAKSQYNLGVSQLRQYSLAKLDEAYDTFSRMTQETGSGYSRELKAFAYVAMANVNAHRIIFWGEELAKSGSDQLTRSQHSVAADRIIQEWTTDAEESIAAALSEVGKIRDGCCAEDELHLEWAIANSRGNIALNMASNFCMAPEVLENTSDQFREETSERARKCLVAAEKYFKKCSELLVPGVEALSNLATTYLKMGKFEKGLRYAEKAIEVNPFYEYAYYRKLGCFLSMQDMASAQALKKNFGEVVGAPHIPKMKILLDQVDD